MGHKIASIGRTGEFLRTSRSTAFFFETLCAISRNTTFLNLTNKSEEELRELHKASGLTIISMIDCLSNRPDMQAALRRLMDSDDMLDAFIKLVAKESDLMRRVLQASVAALVNTESVIAMDAELKRRAIKGN